MQMMAIHPVDRSPKICSNHSAAVGAHSAAVGALVRLLAEPSRTKHQGIIEGGCCITEHPLASSVNAASAVPWSARMPL